MADEGLHEIQLNGKQLVFLFMASTIVAVVIFLCGVMVGRGVRVQRPADAIEASVDAATDPTVVTEARAPAASTAAAPTNTPVASQETLTYPDRLEGHEPAEETLKPGSGIRNSGFNATAAKPVATIAKVAPPPPKAVPATRAVPVAPVATPTPTPAPSPSAAPPALSREPAGTGFVVQVAAVNDRREADTIAKRLAAKGYPSFVTTPPNGTPRTFRVRIGKYPNRRDAESIAARLRKEEQFKPWITR
jgi:cell division septation protein DedD